MEKKKNYYYCVPTEACACDGVRRPARETAHVGVGEVGSIDGKGLGTTGRRVGSITAVYRTTPSRRTDALHLAVRRYTHTTDLERVQHQYLNPITTGIKGTWSRRCARVAASPATTGSTRNVRKDRRTRCCCEMVRVWRTVNAARACRTDRYRGRKRQRPRHIAHVRPSVRGPAAMDTIEGSETGYGLPTGGCLMAVRNLVSQFNDLFSDFNRYISPAYHHDRCER